MQILNALQTYFKAKSPSIAGLHIGADGLKLICLSKAGEHFQVEHYASVALPPGVMQENAIKDSAAITVAVKQLVAQTNGKIKNVAIALPVMAVISKVIQLNAILNEIQLEEFIQFEAEQHLPHPIDEVSLDFQVLGANPKNPQLIDVLLVASHKNNIEARVAAIAAGGIQVKIVDVETHAIERACQLLRNDWPARGVQQTVAVVTLSALVLSLVVLHNNEVVFTRSENVGSEQLTNTLPDDDSSEVLAPFTELVLLQIKRLLQFFFSTAQTSAINYFVIAGGSVQLPGLAAKIAEQLNLIVAVADPFANMLLAPAIDVALLKQAAPDLLLCTGLALHNFGPRWLAS
jgi:type IV pilus assembly protein PilM